MKRSLKTGTRPTSQAQTMKATTPTQAKVAPQCRTYPPISLLRDTIFPQTNLHLVTISHRASSPPKAAARPRAGASPALLSALWELVRLSRLDSVLLRLVAAHHPCPADQQSLPILDWATIWRIVPDTPMSMLILKIHTSLPKLELGWETTSHRSSKAVKRPHPNLTRPRRAQEIL